MAKVTQTKDKDFDAIEPRVNFNDMPEERFTKIVQACRDAYSKCLLQLCLSETGCGSLPSMGEVLAVLRIVFLLLEYLNFPYRDAA